MTREEDLIRPLAEACGLELSPDADGLYDLDVGTVPVVLRCESARESWLMMAPVDLPAGTSPTPALLRRALEMNLLGTHTNDCHLGLLGDSLVLSRRIGVSGLDAKAFAEALDLFAQTVEQVTEGLVAEDPSAQSVIPHTIEENFYV